MDVLPITTLVIGIVVEGISGCFPLTDSTWTKEITSVWCVKRTILFWTSGEFRDLSAKEKWRMAKRFAL